MLSSAQKIAVLGGGQLGIFLTIAAKRLGYRVTVWDPDASAPAHAWADTSIKTAFNDPDSLQAFVRENEAITFEWENIPVALLEAIERECPVRPGSAVLQRLQNRIKEKDFLSSHDFPVTPWLPILKKEDLIDAGKRLGFPVILKTATAGYDGIGQWLLKSQGDLKNRVQNLKIHDAGWILEKVAPFSKELSIIVARNVSGQSITYPVTENRHEGGILRYCQVPAAITPAIEEKAAILAREILSALQGVGVFCIEFFLLEDGCLLINEIAPRPHNSGHYTLDATSISQYEQQLRVLCDLPIEAPQLLSPAVMLNLLGSEIQAIRKPEALHALLAIPGLKVYDYRKIKIKARRKMGHITVMAPAHQELMEKVGQVQTLLKKTSERP